MRRASLLRAPIHTGAARSPRGLLGSIPEMFPVTRLPVHLPLRGAALALAVAALAGCSSIENFVSGDKLDYRSQGSRTPGLEVPPDLTQLARDTRYAPTGGAVSASTLQGAAAAPAAVQSATTVAPTQIGDVRIEREGNQRWLVTPMTPEQLWPRLQAFWKDSGFVLVIDQAATGIMETDWNENRAKLPQDAVRRTIGRVFDSLYSTGERDKFRTRLERNASGGTEIYISHRGMVEVFSNSQKDQTMWQPRAADPELEAEFLRRLLVKLGLPQEQAKKAVASTPAKEAARVTTAQGQSAVQLDDGFDRAWRRVGLALDRTGFTVEDRDRNQGMYFVRYVEPGSDKNDGSFFGKLFGGGSGGAPLKYRVLVRSQGESTTVTVLDDKGKPDTSANAQRILKLLADDLK